MQQQLKTIPKKQLGNTNIQATRIGLGCMGLSVFYTTQGVSEEEGIALIGKALDQGVNFFDTAYLYGDNEKLLAKAMKKYGRDKFIIASKFFPYSLDKNMKLTKIDATSENIRKFCNLSLQRLEIDQIDLYYAHRIDPDIPIEHQAQVFKELINEGKIKHYGLSEASEDTIRRAHAIHPVTAVQEEYSLFTRDIETNNILNTCKELNIALVAYSPLGRGILTGTISKTSDLDKNDHRGQMPRFSEENLKKNNDLVDQMKSIATSLNITASQLALAWLLEKGDNIFLIPGTKKEKYLTENNQSASINLDPKIVKQLDEMFPASKIAGQRYNEKLLSATNITTKKL